MMTLTLPDDIEAQIKTEALKQGVDVDEYVLNLLNQTLSKSNSNAATIFLLKKWMERDATDDPE